MLFDHNEPGRLLFSEAELRCKLTHKIELDPRFATMLVTLRLAFDESMTPTSCCRSAAHNQAEGGHPRSLHVYDLPWHEVKGTCAIDIRSKNTAYARRLVAVALGLGWSVGVNKRFIHLDRRDLAGLEPGLFGY